MLSSSCGVEVFTEEMLRVFEFCRLGVIFGGFPIGFLAIVVLEERGIREDGI